MTGNPAKPDLLATPASGWTLVSDGVMGGVSHGRVTRETLGGREAVRLRGTVSTENNGGFLQIALDLAPRGATFDARGWVGLALEVFGNGQTYNLHLRTTDLDRPWQSYRQVFAAPPRWTTVCLPFADFAPHRTDRPLDLGRLRRVGIVAIGREFEADIALAAMRLVGEG